MQKKRVPFFEPYHFFKRNEMLVTESVAGFLGSSSYIGGEAVSVFEASLAVRTGRQFALGVSSGLDALEIALRASELTAGSKVVVPGFSFAATLLAPLRMGCEVVFCDVEPNYAGLDPEKLALVLEKEKPDAVIYVPLFGYGPQAQAIEALCQKHGVLLVEDAAQSVGGSLHGRPFGSFGDISAVSFYPTKPLGAAGDGGAVLTNHYRKAHLARKMANYGSEDFYDFELPAFNSRLNSLQAVYLKAKIDVLDEIVEERQKLFLAYWDSLNPLANLGQLVLPQVPPEISNAGYLYVIKTPHRDALQAHLNHCGIQATIHYAKPLNHLSANGQKLGSVALPVAEALANTVLSLPLFNGLGGQRQQWVCDAVKVFFKNK